MNSTGSLSLALAQAGLQIINPFKTTSSSASTLTYQIRISHHHTHQPLLLQLSQWPDPTDNLQLKSYRHSKTCQLQDILPSNNPLPFNPLQQITITKLKLKTKTTTTQTTTQDHQQPSRSKSPTAWIYLDLIQPSTQLTIHLQLFIQIDPISNSHHLTLSRFDLNSSKLNPNPSNTSFGSTQISHALHPDNNPHTIIHLKLTEQEIDQEFNHLFNKQNTKLPHYPSSLKQTNTIINNLVPTSKSISIFSYVSHPKIIASFGAGHHARYHQRQQSLTQDHHPFGFSDSLIIRSDHLLSIGDLNDPNRAWFFIQHTNSFGYIIHRSVFIHPISGLVTEADKLHPLASTSDTQSIFLPNLDLCISYGFHDSPRMGKRHCMYAYVTPDHSSWLEDLINENPKWLDERFSRLVLQGSHDSGMFTSLHPGFVKLITKMKLDAELGNFLIDHGIQFIHGLTKLMKVFNIDLERAICNIANTQKDTIYDQLRLGARFFDFRPGYCLHDCLNGERGKIYHQHACVPGYEYVKALEETFSFLASHPKEVVVFELKSDGFVSQKTTWRKDSIPFHSMIPTKAALGQAIEEARMGLKATWKKKELEGALALIKVGGPADLDRPIGDLLAHGIRLIVIHRMGSAPESGWEWQRDDSYDHVLYDTDRPEPIIKALDATHSRNAMPQKAGSYDPRSPASRPLMGSIYQLQATPTKNLSDDITSSLTYSKASSLLVYTKATIDPCTYKWVKDRLFIEPGLVVLLNDFVDPVLTEHALEKSKLRARFFSSV